MKILIVAGGTGGHLYPGIALAQALTGHETMFVVRRGDLGKSILEKEGFPVREITGQGLPRVISFRLLTFPFKLIQGWSEAWSLLKEFRPDRVLGMGGYLSVPVVLSAHWLGIRTMLHEQNVYPGLANRFLRRWVDSVAVSFDASKAYLKGKNVWVSGLPVRADIGTMDVAESRRTFGLAEGKVTFLVFGGSQGAQRLNERVLETWSLMASKSSGFQVLHIAGEKNFALMQERYAGLTMTSKVLPYCHQMAAAYAAADVVICRSGASTIAELLAARRPSVLVPFPHASNNHQLYNARILAEKGLGEIIEENDLTPEKLAGRLRTVVENPAELKNWQGRFNSVGDQPNQRPAHSLAERLRIL